MKKKTRTIEILEAKVLHQHGGKIDLKQLWAEEEDKELEPHFAKPIRTLNENPKQT